MSYSRRQLYALGEPLGEFATRKVGGRIIYGMGGGGGGAPTQQTITQSNIPDWLRPQVETLLGGATQQLFNTSTDADGNISITGAKPFNPFGVGGAGISPEAMQGAEAAVAGFTPLQNQAFQGAANLQTPEALNQAATTAGNVATAAGNLSYTPTTFGNAYQAPAGYQAGSFSAQQVNAPALTQYQMAPVADVEGQQAAAAQLAAAPQAAGAQGIAALAGAAPQATAAQFAGPEKTEFERVNAERVTAPQLRDLTMQAAAPVTAERVSAPMMATAQTGYRPDIQTFQMQAPSERVTSESFTRPGTAASFMSPYMDEVVTRQQQAAQREADIQREALGAQFAQAGAFGGGRFGVQQARAAEALARQKGDIRAQGLQNAFQQAQQQFNTEQQARQGAQGANLQAGLTVGQQNLAAQQAAQQLGVQTGLQTSLANLSAEQQANVQNQATQFQAAGMNAQSALQAALANQQNQQQANVQNLSAALQTQGLGAQTGMTAQQLNQASGLQALLANQQAGMQTGQFNSQMDYNTALQNAQFLQQAGLANQQMGGQFGLANLGNQQQMALANLGNQQAANLANQQMLGQFGLQQGQFNQAAALQNAQLAQQAGLANQQAGLTVGQQNLAALLGVQQLGAGQSLQAQMANQQAGMTAQQLAEQSRQFGFGQDMAAAQLAAQYGLAGQQATEQSQQFGANFGLQGLAQQLAAAQAQGGLGAQQLAAQQGILGFQSQLGGTQQQQQQNIINQAIQNYANAQQYPLQQFNAYNALLRGYAVPGQTATTYQAAPSVASQLGGLGLAGAGMYRLAGGAKGGSTRDIEDRADRFAEGGIATINRNVLLDPNSFSNQQLQQGAKNGVLNPVVSQIGQGINNTQRARMQADAAAQRPVPPPVAQQMGVEGLPSNLPVQGYAPGGIVAFDDGGEVERFQVGGVPDTQTGSPAGRFFRSLLPANKSPSGPTNMELLGIIGSEYKDRAELPGVFATQTDEERKRAQEIMKQARGLFAKNDTAGLMALAQQVPGYAAAAGAKNAVADLGELGYNTDRSAVGQAPKVSPGAQAVAGARGGAEAGGAPAGSAGIGGLGTNPELTFFQNYIKNNAPTAFVGPQEPPEQRINRMMGPDPTKGPFTQDIKDLTTEREKLAKDILNEQERIFANTEAMQKRKADRLALQEAAIGKDERFNEAFSLMKAGFGMLNARPGSTFLQALGQGSTIGIEQYEAGMDKIRKAKERYETALDALEQARIGTDKDKIAAKENFHKVLLQNKDDIIKGNMQAFGLKRQQVMDIINLEQKEIENAQRDRQLQQSFALGVGQIGATQQATAAQIAIADKRLQAMQARAAQQNNKFVERLPKLRLEARTRAQNDIKQQVAQGAVSYPNDRAMQAAIDRRTEEIYSDSLSRLAQNLRELPDDDK